MEKTITQLNEIEPNSQLLHGKQVVEDSIWQKRDPILAHIPAKKVKSLMIKMLFRLLNMHRFRHHVPV